MLAAMRGSPYVPRSIARHSALHGTVSASSTGFPDSAASSNGAVPHRAFTVVSRAYSSKGVGGGRTGPLTLGEDR